MTTRQPHPSRAVAALARLDLLRDVVPVDLDVLGADTDLVDVAAGVVIEHGGRTARQLVGIVDGAVRAVDPGGDVVVLGSGDQLGAAELVHDRPHRRTYTTVVPTTLVVVFGASFRAFAGARPELLERHRLVDPDVAHPPAALATSTR